MDANDNKQKGQLTESVNVQKRYQLLLQHARDIILFVRASDGRILEANEAAVKEYAYPKDELLSLTIKDLREPITAGSIPSQLQTAASGGIAFETLHRRKDGTSFPAEVSSNGVDIDNVRILLSIIRNVAERKDAEAALRVSEERFHSMFSQSPVGIEVYHADGKLIDANPACLTIFGIDSINEVKGFDLFADPNLTGEAKERLVRGEPVRFESIFDFDLIRQKQLYHTNRSGRCYIDCMITPLLGGSSRIGYLVYVRDITPRKIVEEQLRDKNRLLNGILQAIPDIVYFKDWQGDFLFVNKVFEQTWDLTASTVLGKTNDQVLPSGARDAANASDREVIERGVVIHYENEATTPRGIVRFETTKIPLINEQGITTGLVGISRDISERKRAETQIRSAHKLLDLTLSSLEEAVFVVSPVTRSIELVNETAERMFGYTKDEMIGKSSVFLHVNEEMHDRFGREMLHALKATGYFKTEYRMKRKQGEIFFTEHFVRPIMNERGDIENVVSVVRDVTERKQAVEALHRSEEKYRDLFENAVDAILIVDDQFRYVDANKRATELFGYTKEEFLGMSIFDSMPFEQIPRSQEALKKLQTRGKYEKFLGKSRTKDGRWLDIEVSSSAVVVDGKIVGSRDIIRDITERKRTEENLAASQKSLQAVVDSVDAIVYVADMQTYELLLLNNYARSIFGEAVGRQCWKTLQKDQQGPCSFCTNSKLVGTNGQPLDTYVWEVQNTVNGRWYECRDKAVRWIDDRIVRMEIATDITDRKKLEQEMIRSQKLESVSILAGGIAHDFNNLLQGIIGNIALAKMYAGGVGKLHDRLQDAEESADRAKELSYRLLTFAKGGEPARQLHTVDNLIKNSFNLILSGSPVQSEFDIAADLHAVEVDEGQMAQVFRNLAINAKEAMTSGGMIKVRARNVTLSAKDNLPVSDGEYVRISVADQGVGIPPENLSKIFDPYFTTKEMSSQKGLGLGLAVCFSVVKKHHGVITVESKVGRGSTFHIFLPAAVIAAPAEKIPSDSTATASSTARILIMEDEELVRNIIKEILELLGYDAVLTREGNEAVQEYQRALTARKPFDLVLLDLTIPGGMGGIETLRKLREINPTVRVIVSSGYVDDPIIRDCHDYGFVSALTKPYSVEQLRNALHEVLNPEV